MSAKWIASIFVVSLALRLTALFLLDAAGSGIETAHHEHESIAKSLAAGGGFRFNFFGDIAHPDLTSQQAPLVPGLLAACFGMFGIESKSAFGAMIVIQVLASSLTAVGIGWLAESMAKSGRAAGLLAAVYPPLIVSGLHVQALVWNLFWLVGLLVSTQCMRQDRSWTGTIGFALASIGALHTDPILGIAIVGLLALLTFEPTSIQPSCQRPMIERVWTAAAILLLIAVGLAPWTIRNYEVHGRFILVKDSFWYVFWQGNNRITQGTDKLLVPVTDAHELEQAWDPTAAMAAARKVRHESASVNDCLSSADIALLQSLPREIDRMDQFRRWAVDLLVAEPGHYLRLCAMRFWYWIWFDATNPRAYLVHYRAGYVILVSLAVCGIWMLRAHWQCLLPVLIVAIALTSVHVSIITSARFRIPLELLYLIPASAAVEGLMIVARKGLNRPATFAAAR